MIKAKTFCATYRNPLGWLQVEGSGRSLSLVKFVSKKTSASTTILPLAVRRELRQYFDGQRKKFSLKLRPKGTLFQKKVWKALKKISYGKSVSYGELAARMGRPKSVRAVARAISQNKLAIVIPCHRVIGADGSLTGYAYGLRKKAWLLRHETGL